MLIWVVKVKYLGWDRSVWIGMGFYCCMTSLHIKENHVMTKAPHCANYFFLHFIDTFSYNTRKVEFLCLCSARNVLLCLPVIFLIYLQFSLPNCYGIFYEAIVAVIFTHDCIAILKHKKFHANKSLHLQPIYLNFMTISWSKSLICKYRLFFSL